MNPPSASAPTGPLTTAQRQQHWQRLYLAGRHAELIDEALGGALDPSPGDVALLNLAAAAAKAHAQADLAEAWWRKALDVAPRNADLHYNLGDLLHACARHSDAEACYRRALKLNAQHVAAWGNLAALLQQLGRVEEALAAYRRALALAPDTASTHFNLALLLKQQGRYAEAEQALRRVMQLAPGQYDAQLELAALLRSADQAAQAEQTLLQLLSTEPGNARAYNELGALYIDTHRDQHAHQALDTALQLSSGLAPARWNQGLLHLRQGRYAEGWPLAEARLDLGLGAGAPKLPPLPQPRWRDESLAGRTILLCHEQGLGDLLQFCRYVPVLKQLGASRVGLSCPTALHALLRTLPGLDALHAHVYDDSALTELAAYDCWEMTLSLPLHFPAQENAIPANTPYLHADAERLAAWRERLGASEGLRRVGLVWSGNPAHRNDRHRSLPGLQTLAPLWQARSDVQFHALNPGIDSTSLPASQPLTNLGPELHDFADTAAALCCMDVLIAVDTAAVHVAGAIGRPCWLMLPWHSTDWRWLDARSDSPWYPQTLRLFRQHTAGDWAPVVAELVQALQAL